MSRTYRSPDWRDDHATRQASKRASTLVRVGAVPPAAFCLGKESYGSRNDARHAAKMIRERFGKNLHEYRCPRCQTVWHLATTEHKEE